MNVKKKKNTINIAIESSTHYGAFFFPVLFFLLFLLYTIKTVPHNYSMLFLAILFIIFQYFFLFYKKKIIITDKKIYLYVRGNKKISWDLINDFLYIDYKQDKLGKFFNYGSLFIMNQNKQSFAYHYLSNCEEVRDQIIINYELQMKKINPDYEIRFIKHTQLDTIKE